MHTCSRLVFSLLLLLLIPAAAAPRQVRVFIALCDNKTQGIVPVGEKIGDGNAPDANLYWGCTDGFGAWFRQSKAWKITASEKDTSPTILRRMSLLHTSGDTSILCEAYRGSAIRQCLQDFEIAAASGQYDLVAYIGHNVLMEASIPPPPAAVAANKTAAIVLCCKSDTYFTARLRASGSQPLLMTQQFMYPGAFLLDAALRSWRTKATPSEILQAAATAYAKNQKISLKSAKGVFIAPAPGP